MAAVSLATIFFKCLLDTAPSILIISNQVLGTSSLNLNVLLFLGPCALCEFSAGGSIFLAYWRNRHFLGVGTGLNVLASTLWHRWHIVILGDLQNRQTQQPCVILHIGPKHL